MHVQQINQAPSRAKTLIQAIRKELVHSSHRRFRRLTKAQHLELRAKAVRG